MFFKPNKHHNQKSVYIALTVIFIFWGSSLLINSIFEKVHGQPLISSSIVLISGLALFFIIEFVLTRFIKIK
ncbi:hypothetical protein MUB24_04095 [Lederbergia sp. NSJ-179]|uniref:hypothetical protein n=1 Tax=Lederbergia sp. NSJ-179 TaxID=2931402 RepID=UPI001FD05A62|nr:hypothetical protein [Lederbergia sp. NSJ-179]MCJ7840105.1 hypothetical protein [Lederbergia sp. NSJ-179]